MKSKHVYDYDQAYKIVEPDGPQELWKYISDTAVGDDNLVDDYIGDEYGSILYYLAPNMIKV